MTELLLIFTSQWRMFLVYFALALVCAIISYFVIVETKGLPVEEIGALFGDEVVVHLTKDGHGILEDKPDSKQMEFSSVQTVEKV